MGKLYEKMKMDMELKNYSARTISCYLAQMRAYVSFFDQSPDNLGQQHIREYLHYLIKKKKRQPGGCQPKLQRTEVFLHDDSGAGLG